MDKDFACALLNRLYRFTDNVYDVIGKHMFAHDDLSVGQVLKTGPRTVTKQEIIDFATLYDPQPFHLDDNHPTTKAMGGIIASGWHTTAIFMRMLCDGFLLNSTSQGASDVPELNWIKPVRPDDTLYGESTVVKTWVAKSKPDLGFLELHNKITNQDGKLVMTSINIAMMATRAALTGDKDEQHD